MSEPNWWIYKPKHCARFYTWRPACREFASNSTNEIKYFTLCGVDAVDVFMLEEMGILNRNRNQRIQNITICEMCWIKITEIEKTLKPPLGPPILYGEIGELLTSVEDENIESAIPRERDTIAQRKAAREKRSRKDLMRAFPFDIINFDPCASLLDVDHHPTLRPGLEKVFEIQRDFGKRSFLLILTTPISHSNSRVSHISESIGSEFHSDYEANIENHEEIRNEIQRKFGTLEYDGIEEKSRIAISIAKSIILKNAKDDWICEHKGVDIYENNHHHQYLSSVILFTRRENGLFDGDNYLDEVTRVIREYPAYYSLNASENDEAVAKDLGELRAYAEEVKRSYED